MATLKEIQDCELRMLKDIDKICRENNLKYSLAWGTMLGAVRHQGFIPWDDDADIDMPYKDMKKFEKIIAKEYSDVYFFDGRNTNPGCFMLYGKLRKNGTYMKTLKQEENSKHLGLWIDILPLISLSDITFLRKLQYKFFKFIRFISSLFAATKKINNKPLVDYFIIKWPLKILEKISWGLICVLGVNGSEYLEVELPVSCGYPEEEYAQTIFKKDFYTKLKEYKFCDTTLFGTADSDGFLTKMYGSDYMTPKKYAQHVEDYDNVRV